VKVYIREALAMRDEEGEPPDDLRITTDMRGVSTPAR